MSLMLEEVARILRAYKELRDSRLNDVLDALSPPVSRALAAAFGSSSYALGPAQYELRSADLPGARRVLEAATRAMVGGNGVAGAGAGGANGAEGGAAAAAAAAAADAGGCREALLQEPFEELVRRLARRVSTGVETAARSKGKRGDDGGGAAGAGRGGGAAAVGGGGDGGGGFTEWGALLLRKEVRTLQQGLAALMETDSLNAEFDELNELVSERAGGQAAGKIPTGSSLRFTSSSIDVIYVSDRVRELFDC